MSHHRTLMQVLAGIAAVLVVTPPAQAGAYAYSTNDIGLAIGNVTLANPLNAGTSRADDDAEYRRNARDANSHPRNPDPAASGPGPFPGRDAYGAQGPVGQYARADAILDAVLFNDLRGRNVAEAYRTSPGDAYGDADMDVGFALAWAGGAPITISLFAAPALRVSTDAARESAHADLNFRFTFFDNGVQMFQWTPNGTLNDFVANPAYVVTNQTDPFSLQRMLDCTGVCARAFNEAGTFHIEFRPVFIGSYDVRIQWGEHVTVAVAEPATLPLLGAASFAALAASARRRRADARAG